MTKDSHTGWKRHANRYGLLLCLVLGGVLYHGAYYNHGFLSSDEGSVAFIAQRLLAGETPYRQVPIGGYGLLWYMPISALFAISENDFCVMKIYFHALLIITGLLGYALLRRLGVAMWLALTCAAILVVVPGTPHKAYIPFCMIANIYILTGLDLDRTVLAWRQVFLLGLAVGVTALIRTDQGIYLGGLYAGLLIAHAGLSGSGPRRAVGAACRTVALLVLGVALTFLPFLVSAHQRGYAPEFLQRYAQTVTKVGKILVGRNRAAGTSKVQAGESGSEAEWLAQNGVARKATHLARPPLSALGESGKMRTMAFLTYSSLLAILCMGVALSVRIFWRRLGNRPFLNNEVTHPAMAFMISMSGYLPFFFFRPDMPHFSQFMPVYFVLTTICLHLFLKQGSTPRGSKLLLCAATRLFLCLLLSPVAVYLWTATHDAATGSIARRLSNGKLYEAANGIRVYVSPRRHDKLVALRDFVLTHSGPDDDLVCFPYAPGYNVMCDRATCMFGLYVDDHLAGSPWIEETVARIRDREPAIILINNRAINGTPASRFFT